VLSVTTYIFVGPTLPIEAAQTTLDATYLPPVSRGDVLSLCRLRPTAIGIIDGFFERAPSVWHKEILWALSEGIHVFGAASMGALRAAELNRFGMIGVGKIFEAYLSGELEDDDEVAVVHGPADIGYLTVSEAMVNIRYTMGAAEADGIICADSKCRLLKLAKQHFYAERDYSKLLAKGLENGLSHDEIGALRKWLPTGRRDQKRVDALAMLQHIGERDRSSPEHKSVRFTFQRTDAWEQLRREMDGHTIEVPCDHDHDASLTELRLEGKRYIVERERAVERSLCLGLANAIGLTPDNHLLQSAARQFCGVSGLNSPEGLDGWLKDQNIDAEDFDRLLRDEARVFHARALVKANVKRDLPDYLRITAQYGVLRERAIKKHLLLASHGLENPSLSDLGLTDTNLWGWYFEDRLGMPIPDDLSQYEKNLDFENDGDLQRAAIRELCFVYISENRPFSRNLPDHKKVDGD
jgi:hypothetical protein